MSGFLALKREKSELERKLDKLGTKIQATREEHEELKRKHASMGESLKALSAESRRLEVETALSLQGHPMIMEAWINRLNELVGSSYWSKKPLGSYHP